MLIERVSLNFDRIARYEAKRHTYRNMLFDSVQSMANLIIVKRKHIEFNIPTAKIQRIDTSELRQRYPCHRLKEEGLVLTNQRCGIKCKNWRKDRKSKSIAKWQRHSNRCKKGQHISISFEYCHYPMSFALARQSKNEASDSKTSISAKHSSSYNHHFTNFDRDPPDYSLHLQRTSGNQQSAQRAFVHSNNNAVAGFDFASIGVLHPKLKISQPTDEYEQEADRLAEQVMRIPSQSDSVMPMGATKKNEEIDRKCAGCELNEKEENEKELNISRKPSAASNSERADEIRDEVNSVRSGGGSSLDANTKEFMESRFGYDFSDVRIHADESSAMSARSVNALAYAVGNDIVFEQGQYQPRTLEGRKLLAHELTHVVQQGAALPIVSVMRDDNNLCESRNLNAMFITQPSSHQNLLTSLQRSIKEGGGERCGGPWRCAESPCDRPDPGHEGGGGTATSWTLRAMIDIEAPSAEEVSATEANVGHTYVEFSDSTGARYTYGFYPDKSSGQTPDPLFHPAVAGCTVHPDNSHRQCIDYIETFSLRQEEYQRALEFARAYCMSPPTYNLLNNNCTTFVKNVVERAGRSLPPVRGKVGSGMLAAVADNPYTLIEGLRRRDIGPTYGLTSDTDIRNAINNASTAEISAIPVVEKVRVVRRLFSGWVSDDDIGAIEIIYRNSTNTEKEQIRGAINVSDLSDQAQRARLRFLFL